MTRPGAHGPTPAGGPAEPVAHPVAIPVALSTASTYPESTAAAFEMAARLGYDGVEIMVWNDPVSQSIDALRRLSDYHAVPILAIHSPCLIVTQRVWGVDPWGKLTKAQAAAEALGAAVVVVHPPFRWQRDYARQFADGIERLSGETPVRFAVENMFPLRALGPAVVPYSPGWSPVDEDYRDVTLDLSHTAVSQSDAVDFFERLAGRLAHIHLADGSGSPRDEHLVPGRGTQPCAEVLSRLAGSGFAGTVVVEISTRKATSRTQREADLTEALAYARRHLTTPATAATLSTAP